MDQEETKGQGKEIATLGGGCFWCLEPIFRDVAGVEQVVVGCSGGDVPNPSYRHVCTGTTGHAEVVQVTFYPKVISFREILEIFFSVHDPTTPNRQGADVGPQYRSIILYHSQEQKRIAERMIQDLEAANVWSAPIVTEVVPFKVFYEAEGYHQGYFEKNPAQPYCRVVVEPKVSKFRKKYSSKLKN
ncbi:MAG: peptide-methionine (S)-S-oxide reductase MsrA [Deltaproteobacteria bacterium]